MTIVDDRAAPCAFEHDALIYDSDEGYVEALAPLLSAAHDAGDAIFAVVPARQADLLRSGVGRCAGKVEFIDAAEWYVHPVATIAAYIDILAGLPEGRPAFVVGEVQFGDTASEWASWTRYEAVLNRTLARYDARVVCPYDRRTLPAEVVDDARRTHPYLVATGGGRAPSERYVRPDDLLPLLPHAVEVPGSRPDLELVVDGDVRAVRRAFSRIAAHLGRGRRDELTLAVNEIVSNALVHGSPPICLRVWVGDDGGLTCVVDDAGPGVGDVAVGYTRPRLPAQGGYGAWLARRLFDRVEFLPSDAGGTRVALVAGPPA